MIGVLSENAIEQLRGPGVVTRIAGLPGLLDKRMTENRVATRVGRVRLSLCRYEPEHSHDDHHQSDSQNSHITAPERCAASRSPRSESERTGTRSETLPDFDRHHRL